MQAEIKNNLDNPSQLEKLYRDNKMAFKREFNLIYPEIQDTTIAQIWNARINYENEEISWGTNKELVFVIIASLIAGLIAKLPEFMSIKPDYFYPRNIAFIIFPLLTIYFAWKQKFQVKRLLIIAAVILGSCIYINLLPDNPKSDTLILACIHLPILLWATLGFTFVGDKPGSMQRRLDFLRYNGELVVMTAIIILAGILLTAITFGLFRLIGVEIEKIFSQYIGVWGLAATPIVGTYLVRTNPQLVNKIPPVIAKIFTPIVLATLVIYFLEMIFIGKDPYNDREFLMVFNLLLIGVMAIILFSVTITSKNPGHKTNTFLLFALSIVTVVVNGIALSAILFRIFEGGLTPNRLAVMGGNILILINLLMVTFRLFKTIQDKNEIGKVENSIASFLPIYALWTFFVTFFVPLLFHFK
jgi:hypothetical protein